MRQSNGTDILGINDPRGGTIGIIYISPDDERASVLAAILTQEKLARQVIVVVLPAQNKAFQRPVDFDGLKNMRRTLKAQLVLIAPQGSGPAEFARQRRFTIFWSLEAYAQSLRTRQQETQPPKRGWPFGRKLQPQPPDNVPASQVPMASVPAVPPVMAMLPNQQPNFSEHQDVASLPTQAPPVNDPVVSNVEQRSPLNTNTAPRTDDVLQPQRMGAFTDEQANVARQDTLEPPDEVFEDTSDNGEEESDPDKTQPSSRNTGQPLMPVSEPQPVILTPRPSRIPNKPNIPHDSRGVQSIPSVDTGNTGRTGGTGGIGKVVGARSMFWTRLSNTRRRWLFALLILLLLLIIGGGIYTAFSVFGTEVTATVTITPMRKTLQNTYTIFAVTGVRDSVQSQIEARFLSFTPPQQSQTIPASGHGTMPATHATGTLTFYNPFPTQQTIPINTIVTDAKGISVITDASVTLPAAQPSTKTSANVSAHTINTGTSGNIPANDFTNIQCCATGILVQNLTAFTGGQNQQTYPYVQQSDIDSATNQLSNTLSHSGQTGVMEQISPGEQLISQINCVSSVKSNHGAGDKAANVTVTVTETCSGEVYNLQQARVVAEDLLKTDAMKSPGANYVLSGGITTTIFQVKLVNPDGKISLMMMAEGVWVYKFSDAQKRQLAQSIAGKSEKDALAVLSAANGVRDVNVQINGGDGNTLPGDTKQITVVVRS